MNSLNSNQFLGNRDTDEKGRWRLHSRTWCGIISFFQEPNKVGTTIAHFVDGNTEI